MDVPDILLPKGALFSKFFSSLDHPLCLAVQRLLYVSDYANRQHKHLKQLLEEDNCQTPLKKEDYHRLVTEISFDIPSHAFAVALRHFRHRHFLRLALRELANIASTEETMLSWSQCADALILHTLHYCEKQLFIRHGRPLNEAGELVRLQKREGPQKESSLPML